MIVRMYTYVCISRGISWFHQHGEACSSLNQRGRETMGRWQMDLFYSWYSTKQFMPTTLCSQRRMVNPAQWVVHTYRTEKNGNTRYCIRKESVRNESSVAVHICALYGCTYMCIYVHYRSCFMQKTLKRYLSFIWQTHLANVVMQSIMHGCWATLCKTRVRDWRAKVMQSQGLSSAVNKGSIYTSSTNDC